MDEFYKIYYRNDTIYFKLNDSTYKLNQSLLTNVWYVAVVNLDQRQRNINLRIYKRNIDISVTLFEPNSFIKATANYGSSDYTDLINLGYKPVDNTEVKNTTDGWILVNQISFDIEPTEYSHTSVAQSL